MVMFKKPLTTSAERIKSSLVQASLLAPRLTEKGPDELLGELFRDVQTKRIFLDGKTFTDLVPKRRIRTIQEDYRLEKDSYDFDLREFIARHFVDLADTTFKPKEFHEDHNRSIDQHIHLLWDHLERRNRLDRGSLLALPFRYIVPGGRFTEQFYWDSYFIMLGLAADNRWDMLEGILKNFAYMIRKYGFIPTGNRTYFLSRSQPPFFSHMVMLLADHKGKRVLFEYLPLLLAEYRFWMKGKSRLSKVESGAYRRVVKMRDGSILNRYFDNKLTPRPESQREDLETAESLHEADTERLYLHLRAAAESGWDFSSRWFLDPNEIRTIHTTDIIPVDLNSLLYHLEITIAASYHSMKRPLLTRKYNHLAEKRKAAIMKYCWDKKSKFFVDYNFHRHHITDTPSLAAAFPLYVNIATDEQAAQVAERLEKDFLKPGGLVTTLNNNGHQWDAPNGWAPLEWVAIKGLENYHQTTLAHEVRRRWLNLGAKVYNKHHKLIEKYDVTGGDGLGGGGEYQLQDGFGWTNGVFLALLKESKEETN